MRKYSVISVVLLLMGISFSAFGQEERKPLPGAVPVEKGGAFIPRRFVIEPSFQYSHFSQESVSISGFTVFEAILIGRVAVKDIKKDIFVPSLTTRFGFKDMELNFKVPYLYRRDEIIEPVEADFKQIVIDDNGLGDVDGSITYHLVKEKGARPDILLTAGFSAPTGKDPYGLRTGVAEPQTPARALEFPTGTGHWGASGGLIFIKTSDPAVLSLNLSYFYNAPRNVGIQKGTDFGKIDLGDSFEYVLGSVFALNENLALTFSYDQRLTWKTEQDGVDLVNSGANIAIMNVGVTYAFSPKTAIDIQVGIGLTEDAPDVTVKVRLPITFRF